MSYKKGEVRDLKIRLCLVVLTVVVMIAAASPYQGNTVHGAASGPVPRVTAITQVTHDGYRKTNLLADDGQAFVTELPAANRVIARVKGSDRTLVPSPFESLQALDLSADHSRLLVSSKSKSGDTEFWTLPVAEGSPQRVGEVTGRDGSWSADGKQLVFAKGAELYIAGADGSLAHRVYAASGSVFAPRFSPDGRRIRFTVSDTEANTTALWEVGRDGSKPHALLGDFAFKSKACCGSWTADGRYYIFQATQTMPNTTIVMTSLWALPDSEHGSPAQITEGPMSFGNAWPSPDNKKIWAIGVQPTVEVVKYEASKKKFVPLLAGLSATDVDFSADGKWIAYVSIPDGALWRARANGSERLQLTPGSERAALPHWSPDGKQIAYARLKPGASWKLALVAANGGESQEVLPESGSQIDANWYPDGARIMFGDFSHDAAGLSIRIFDFKTHKIETVPGSQGLFSPRLSPDGKHIAALSPDNTTLMLYDCTSQKWSTWLKETAGTVSYPSWSTDSQYLYYDDLVTDAEAIRRVKVGSSETEQMFVLGSLERYPGVLGTWSAQAPDGSWMFVRDRSTQEVYQLSWELQ